MEKGYTAENGIKLYGYKNPSLHGFFISLFLKGGSMYESERESGITHFLEHVLVRNVNKRFSMRLYSELDKYAMEFNASTYAEMVQFYLSGASTSFSVGADVVTALLTPIILSKSEIDTERRRIKAEIRENDDKNSMSSFAMNTLYPDTTLKNLITGTMASVDKISAKKLEEYRKRVFTKENIFFYVTGNYTDADIEYLLKKIGECKLYPGEIHNNEAPVSEKFGKRGAEVAIKNGDYTQVRFNFDVDMRRVTSPVLDLVYDNLFGGYASPFFIKMSEEQGLFYDISGSSERYRNIGCLYFSFEVKEKDIIEAVAMSVDILNCFMSVPLGEDAVVRAAYTENADLLLDDMRELNFTFGYESHVLGLGYRGVEDRRRAYEGVSAEQLRLGACEIFSPENLTLTVKGTKKKLDVEKIREQILKLGAKN